jgi:hypothetical protein
MGRRVIEPGIQGLKELGSKSREAMKAFSGGGAKLSSYLGDLIPEETDTVLLPEMDFDKVAEVIGEIIIEG